jgi:CBS domain-containing protein
MAHSGGSNEGSRRHGAPVITTTPHATIKSVAETLLKYRISAVPVVDGKGALVGIISEGDLMHRAERRGPNGSAHGGCGRS